MVASPREAPDPQNANPRICNPRWGSDSMSYGWEMALLVGAAYWLVHASVDWLWQMAGVTIPALLMLGRGGGECGRARRRHVAALASVAAGEIILFRDERRGVRAGESRIPSVNPASSLRYFAP